MEFEIKTAVIFGSRSRLGKSLKRRLRNIDVFDAPREIYRKKKNEQFCINEIHAFLRNFDAADTIVFVAAGLTDTSFSKNDLLMANLELPRTIIRSCSNLDLRCVTFGTVMENLAVCPNNYVLSKLKLGALVRDELIHGAKTMHIQLHTLYGGGVPTPYMFLGQILSSIKTKTHFRMTSGNQIREYHHVDDDAQAIHFIVKNYQSGIFNISHKNPFKLSDLATAIFSEFNQTDLLQIGALKEPQSDNYDLSFATSVDFGKINFRSSIDNVVHYLAKFV